MERNVIRSFVSRVSGVRAGAQAWQILKILLLSYRVRHALVPVESPPKGLDLGLYTIHKGEKGELDFAGVRQIREARQSLRERTPDGMPRT